jgi:(2R)-sulfolactate sulfo-lyase subunit alpha
MNAATQPPDFLIHDAHDDVGVVVVEEIDAGQQLTGWCMETDETVTVKTLEPIPLGHKIALRDIKAGEDVIKYGEIIGRAVADIATGAHLHVHNTKTKKW